MTGWSKNLGEPDETMEFPLVVQDIVDIGDLTVGRLVMQPGWRWSTHVRPSVGGEWCQARHVGVVVSGQLRIVFPDGMSLDLAPDDVYDVAPGHDGYVVGDETTVTIEWSGLRSFAGRRSGAQSRTLVTLLFTDLVESTAIASSVGDVEWRERLSRHFESARHALDRYAGREVKTTGDGMLATFDGPAQALHCALAISRHADHDGLNMRAGVHVGEVEVVGTDVRGVAVHEAARIMAEAGACEVLVSETTRALALGSGFAFEDRGMHTLKGLPGEHRLFAVSEQA